MNNKDIDMRSRWIDIANAFEHLTPSSLDQLLDLYAQEARFKDPFSDVAGREAIRHIFAGMFSALVQPRFEVTKSVLDGNHAVLLWTFRFRFQRYRTSQEQTIRGASHLVLDDTGLITVHRDYWDLAEELYEKLPVIKHLMLWLKRRAATQTPHANASPPRCRGA